MDHEESSDRDRNPECWVQGREEGHGAQPGISRSTARDALMRVKRTGPLTAGSVLCSFIKSTSTAQCRQGIVDLHYERFSHQHRYWDSN